jgi:Glucosamine 6-phosphate synthetase, contains amidotransferase and phosphosugar isomerase domains
VEGTYGLVVLDTKNPHELVVARNGSPIVLGIGDSEMFVASDVAALVRYTKQVVYLDDAEVATVRAADYLTSAIDERDRRGPGEAQGKQSKEPTTVEAEAGDYELGRSRTHAQGDPRAAEACAGRCAAGSTSGSPPPGWAASTWTRASSGRSGR